MNLSHVLLVFRKDGREILRDRRTLFVNVVLPALLYPFIAIFMIEVLSVSQGQHLEPPRIALIDAAAQLKPFLDRQGREEIAETPRQGRPTPITAPSRHQPALVALAAGVAQALHRGAERLDELSQKKPALSPDIILHARLDLLTILRDNDLAVVVAPVGERTEHQRFLVIEDEAHVRADVATDAVDAAITALRHELVVQRLHQAGLEESDLKMLTSSTIGLAPHAETVRTHLAGMIPLLLVILAAVGAFYPALDLIAGERERGTLESLLSWPAARQDIFIGKLLVTCSAAGLSVLLNLLSLCMTAAITGSQLAAAGFDFGAAFSVGMGTLGLSLVALVPLTITLGALSLVLAGLAASAKEAQNYLTPLLLVVMVAAVVAAIPDVSASLVLDLVPITGSVLALKESLQANSIPWVHLLLSTAASITLAAVVVSWAARLLDSEHFAYPGLVRAGWGRFRRWGKAAVAPNGLEVMVIYAIAVAGLTIGGSFFLGMNPVLAIDLPLILFILAPPLMHCWLGDYRLATVLSLRKPAAIDVLCALVAIPCSMLVSSAIGALQPAAPEQLTQAMEDMMRKLEGEGVLATILCVAVVPGICEEMLCRGTLLSGLSSSVGRTGGIILSAFLFATLHLSPYRFLPQFTLGIVLAVLTLRARSIIPGMLLHAGHNAGFILLPLILVPLPGLAELVGVDAQAGHHGVTLPLCQLGIGLLGLALLLAPTRDSAAQDVRGARIRPG